MDPVISFPVRLAAWSEAQNDPDGHCAFDSAEMF